MFYKTENSTLLEIPDNAFGFVFNCWIPEFGYGINSMTYKKQETDIIETEDGIWRRPLLPKDFSKRRAAEKAAQKYDPYYVDNYLEEIRVREWKRRLRGVWFKGMGIDGEFEYIYLTGLHYYILTYWRFQGKWFDFRISDMKLLYVAEYCMQDPDCLGLNEIARRKIGKTARTGAWITERATRLQNHHGGIQSKADDDAEDMFAKAVVHPWKGLPDFFKPLYDTMKGDTPSDELRMFLSSRRGSKAEEETDGIEEPLNSFIDFKASGEAAYDGAQLESYISDETSKTKKPVNIIERQRVVRYCTEIDTKFIGKQWYTTTVELDPNETETGDFQKLTAQCNPLERNKNNRTGTGLYTYFLPAQSCMHFDVYGYADEAKALVSLNNEIQALEDKGDTRGAASFKRKNPRFFKEAFSTDGESSLFNPGLLNEQLDEIQWKNIYTERGDLVWKNGDAFKRIKVIDGVHTGTWERSEIEWVSNPEGKFEKLKGWLPPMPNDVVLVGEKRYSPNNYHYIKIGCDPFKYDKAKDKRRSNCAAYVYQGEDKTCPNNFDEHFTLRYAFREESTRLANNDILKLAWWCGAKVLFERNVNHWKADFTDWGCEHFFEYMQGEDEPGVYMNGDRIQDICNYTEAYINKHIKKVFFRQLIEKETGWLGFKIEDTQKFDEPMAAGLTLMSVRKEVSKPKVEPINILEMFPKRKIS